MAETKTATYKRYNGKDWDTIYFATSASQVGESSNRFFIKPGSNTVNGKQFTENGGITLYSTDIKLSSSDTTTVKDAIAQAMSAIPTGVLTTANYATTLDSVYEKKSDATSAHNTLTNKIDNLTTAVNNRYTKTESDNKYQPKGTYATLGTDGKVPSSQLPSYVDDVIEGYYSNGKFYSDSAKTKEITGEGGKIYTDLTSNKTYRWGGTAWVEISASLALGETEGTAYDGAKGALAYSLAAAALSKANDNEQHKAKKATTLAGYGITDAYTKTESDGKYVSYTGATKDVNLGKHSLFISNKSNNTDNPTIKLSSKGIIEDDICTIITPEKITINNPGLDNSVLMPNSLTITDGSFTGDVTKLGFRASTKTNSETTKYTLYEFDGIESNGKKLTFPEKDGTVALTSDIPDAYTKTESDGKYQPIGNYASATHTHTFDSLTSKPTTLSGYGITDAYTKTETDGKYQPKGNYASTVDLSNRATKIYFEDSVPTSGMVAGDICIEY